MPFTQADADEITSRVNEAVSQATRLTSDIWSMRSAGKSSYQAESVLVEILVSLHHMRERRKLIMANLGGVVLDAS